MDKGGIWPAYPVKRHLIFLVPLFATVALIMVFLHNEDAVEVFFARHHAAYPDLDNIFETISDIFEYGFYCIYVYMLIAGLRRKDENLVRFAISFLVILIATLAFVEVIKICVGRPRPEFDAPFTPFTLKSAFQSFPSGQTTTALIGAAPLALRCPRIWQSFLLGFSPGLMGFTRIYVGKHHPSDVFGSLVFGSLALLAFWWLLHSPHMERLAAGLMKRKTGGESHPPV